MIGFLTAGFATVLRMTSVDANSFGKVKLLFEALLKNVLSPTVSDEIVWVLFFRDFFQRYCLLGTFLFALLRAKKYAIIVRSSFISVPKGSTTPSTPLSSKNPSSFMSLITVKWIWAPEFSSELSSPANPTLPICWRSCTHTFSVEFVTRSSGDKK